MHPNQPKVYAQKAATLETALNDPAIKVEAAEILRQMIDRIDLHPRTDALGLDVFIYGYLAEVLTICEVVPHNEEHPAAIAAECQLSVVAGAGFEPATFRL